MPGKFPPPVSHVICLVLAFAGLVGPVGAEVSQEAAPLSQRIERFLQPALDVGLFSGSLLVARGDEVLYERSFGLANRELGVVNTDRTRFNVASITKPMTMVVGIRMMEAGKLAPSDKLAKFLPDFPRGEEITVEHLMRHRAGIPHRVTTARDETVPMTAADMVERVKKVSLLFEPGEESVYSSAGFSVLARVLEIAGGAPYEELLETYLFAPAGMEHSAHVDHQRLLPHRASCYSYNGDGIVNAPLQDLSFLVGAGSVYSTARDLFTMQRALLTGKLGGGAKISLSRDSGLSWNGSTSGFRAFADWHRESDVTVIVTANLQSGANDRLRAALPRLVAGEQVEPMSIPDSTPAEVSRKVLERYEGMFQLRPGREMDVRAVDGGLFVDQWFLVPTSETTFFSPQDFGVIKVVFGEEGAVEALDWESPGGPVRMPKTGPLAAGA